MGERPKKPFKPLTGYDGSYERVVRSIDLITVLVKANENHLRQHAPFFIILYNV